MTRARDNSFNPFNNQVAGKNFIINGAFDFWQRGTTAAVAVNNYIADRWAMNRGSYQSGSTVSRQLTNDLVNLPNIQYCARVQADSGNTLTGSINLWQALENSNSRMLIGKTYTVSFYARRGANYSSTSNLLNSVMYGGTGVDQGLNAMTGITAIANRNDAITTTWQRYYFTGTMTSSFTQLALVFTYSPTGTSGANDYFEVTGVQLELGSTPTVFSRAGGTIGEELSLCQRYYFAAGWKLGKYANSYQYSSNYYFKSMMRTSPTIAFADAVGNASKMSTYNSSDTRTDNVSPLTVASTPEILVLVPNNNGTGAADVGMSISFTASAEL
jgi:hypothetical protein